jgi:DNA-binding response OmpR family regulator
MVAMRILLVEDDYRFARALVSALRRAGYEIDHAATAQAALAAAPADLVLLDLGLPDADGTEVCRQMRERSDVGIIVLTARGEERERVAGLRCGADDYVVKPFGFPELQARIEAVHRRARPRPAGIHEFGRLKIDLDQYRVYVDGREVTLARKEFQVLAMLAARPEAAVRRERLIQEVWHTSWHGMSRTLDVHMTTLRAKLGAGVNIQTIRGVGYRLMPIQVDDPTGA